MDFGVFSVVMLAIIVKKRKCRQLKKFRLIPIENFQSAFKMVDELVKEGGEF